VETSEQAEFLRQHSYDELQGYYVGKPLPPEQFAQALRGQAPREDAGQPPPPGQARAG
jgi:EAL domain-containing protein (putative c-di-GMP-specific phosphodiesterase class I)